MTRTRRTPTAHALPTTERELQQAILDLLHLFKWETCHVRPLQDRHGRWVTGTTAKGWPDIVALRADRLVAIEVKGTRTMIQPGQLEWLSRFACVPNCHAFLLRAPVDMNELAHWLARPDKAPTSFGFDLVLPRFLA